MSSAGVGHSLLDRRQRDHHVAGGDLRCSRAWGRFAGAGILAAGQARFAIWTSSAVHLPLGQVRRPGGRLTCTDSELRSSAQSR